MSNKVKTFESSVITKTKFQMDQMSIIGPGGEHNSLTIFDHNEYEDEDHRNTQIRSMVVSLTLQEMEDLGKVLLEKVDQIKKAKMEI